MASANFTFQSNYEYQRQQTTTRHAVARTADTPVDADSEQPMVSLAAEMGRRLVQQQSVEVSSKTEQELSGAEAAQESITRLEKRFQKMISVLERMFGVKVQLYDGPDPHAQAASADRSAQPSSNGNPPSQQRRTDVAMREYHHVVESESSRVAIQGTLELNDGRTLDVDFRMDMERSREETFWGEMVISGGRQVDPLVVNLRGNVAQLTQQRMGFDLDGDGEEENVAFATGDSAFLAIDKNRNGSIDNGQELFGPKSGSGFADLAEHDSNGDGLIDALDDIWEELVLVQRDEAGNESLISLQDVGISAFVLERTRSPFSLFNDQGERTGVVRETGLYVRDDGSVDSVQHVDLII